MSTTDGKPRPLEDLRDSGVLWMINRVVFHPRGLALALHFDDYGYVRGWSLMGDGAEVWQYSSDIDEDTAFEAFNRTVAAHVAAVADQAVQPSLDLASAGPGAVQTPLPAPAPTATATTFPAPLTEDDLRALEDAGQLSSLDKARRRYDRAVQRRDSAEAQQWAQRIEELS